MNCWFVFLACEYKSVNYLFVKIERGLFQVKFLKGIAALSIALSLGIPTVFSRNFAEAAKIVVPEISTQFSDYDVEGKEFSFSFAGSTGMKRLPVHVYKGMVRVKLFTDSSDLEIVAYNKDMTKLLKKFKIKNGFATAYFDRNQEISLVFKGEPGRGQTISFSLSQYLSTNTEVAYGKIYPRYNKKGNKLVFKVSVKETSDVTMRVLETDHPLEVSVFGGDLKLFHTESAVDGKICFPLKKGTYYFVTESKCMARIAFTYKATVIAEGREDDENQNKIVLGKPRKISIANSKQDVPYVFEFRVPEKKRLSLRVSDVTLGESGVSMEIHNAKDVFMEGSFMNFSSGVTGTWESPQKYKKGTYYLFVSPVEDNAYGSFSLRLK